MKWSEIMETAMLTEVRIHNAIRPISSLSQHIYHQNDGRKPNGFWWSIDKDWHSFVRTKHPKGKSVGSYNYEVNLPPTIKMVTLTDWNSILQFTISFGVSLASSGRLFWQKGDQTTYDPAQDEDLAKINRCRVPAVDWSKVAASYDAIELPNYKKNDPNRPTVEWLDIDWDVPSGCAWNLTGVSLS